METSYSSLHLINLEGSFKALFLSKHTSTSSDELKEFFVEFPGIVISSQEQITTSIGATAHLSR